jgi:hypothetical protein
MGNIIILNCREGRREWEEMNKEQMNKEQMNKEQGTRNKEQGTGNKEQGTELLIINY